MTETGHDVIPALPDAVARCLGVSIPEAFEILTRLELRGLIRTVGGRYERRFRLDVGGGASEGTGSEAASDDVRAG